MGFQFWHHGRLAFPGDVGTGASQQILEVPVGAFPGEETCTLPSVKSRKQEQESLPWEGPSVEPGNPTPAEALWEAVSQAREEGPGAGVPTLNDGTITGVRDNIVTGILAVTPHPETGDSRRSDGISGHIQGHSSRGIVSEGCFRERGAFHSIRGRNAIQRRPTTNNQDIWGHSLPELQEEPVSHDRSHHPHGVSLWSRPVPYQQCRRR